MGYLPQNHPKREWANLSVCGECRDVYGPPLSFEEWDTVRFDIVSCHFCSARNIMWIGTADWANPKTLLQDCSESMDECDEPDFTTDLRKQFARVTSTCRECALSTSEKLLFQVVKHEAKQLTLEKPMWKPIEMDDIIDDINGICEVT